MEIIVDTNILFSAILKDSTIRKIILLSPIKFFIPEYALKEIEEHLEEIKEKTNLDHNEFYSIYKILIRSMAVIHFRELDNHKLVAMEIVCDIDKEDTMIIAAALSRPNSILWSEDKPLKKQNEIRVFNTAEMIRLLL